MRTNQSLSPLPQSRYLSTTSKNDQKEKTDDESLRDTLNRMKSESDTTASGSEASPSSKATDDIFRTGAQFWLSFQKEVASTWNELVQSGQRKDINKKLTTAHPVATAEGDREYTGPVAIMVIDPSENLTAWERMQKRLAEAPVIQSILEKSEEIYEKSGAKELKRKVDDLKEDAREACKYDP
jgi:hypothetical protein